MRVKIEHSHGCPLSIDTAKTKINDLAIFQNKCLRTIIKGPWFIRNTRIWIQLNIPNYSRTHQEVNLCFVRQNERHKQLSCRDCNPSQYWQYFKSKMILAIFLSECQDRQFWVKINNDNSEWRSIMTILSDGQYWQFRIGAYFDNFRWVSILTNLRESHYRLFRRGSISTIFEREWWFVIIFDIKT